MEKNTFSAGLFVVLNSVVCANVVGFCVVGCFEIVVSGDFVVIFCVVVDCAAVAAFVVCTVSWVAGSSVVSSTMCMLDWVADTWAQFRITIWYFR